MRTIVAAISLALLSAGSALAAPPPGPRNASPDILRHVRSPLLQLRTDGNGRALPAVSDADVGDADSFGRKVTYVGIIASEDVDLEVSGCQPSTDPGYQCVTLNPQPQSTSFNFSDMGHITLPANSTHSLLCFQFTTIQSWEFNNETSSPAESQLDFNESVTIESPLLDDPSLIDPTTGQPFAGKLTAGIGTDIGDGGTLQPGQDRYHSAWSTRACQGGAISKSALKSIYNLPDNIVDRFFREPMTIRLNARGDATLVQFGGMTFGVRFYGD